ncbi:MAG: TonB-dependent receptor, partial [Sphingobium sp.]
MKGRILLAGAAVIALAIPVTAVAQDVPSAAAATKRADSGFDDIIVTARRVEENVQSIPLAVSALSGAALQSQSVRDIKDLSSTVPNLNISNGNADQQAATITIRGQNQANLLLTIDSPVGVYVDGVNNPRAYGLRNGLVDIQRVEILRGPQGTLYGRNTTGGAVSLITQDPKDEFGGSAQLTFGNYETWGIGGVLNIPLSPDMGVRFVAQKTIHQPYIDTRLSSERPNREDGYYFRGKFKGEFGALTVSLTGDYYNNDAGGQSSRVTGLFPGAVATSDEGSVVVPGGRAAWSIARELGLAPATGAPTGAALRAASAIFASYIGRGDFFDSYQSFPLYSKNKGGSVALNLEYALSDAVKLRSITGYRGLSRFTGTDYDGTPFDLHGSTLDTRDDFYSQELQLLGGSDTIDWVVGGYYSIEKGTETTVSKSLFPVLATVGTTDADVKNRSFAFFGQANWHFAPGFNLTVGGRWTKEYKDIVNRNRNNLGCTVLASLLDTPGVCAATFKNSFSDPSWIVSIDYSPTQDVMVYGKVSRGFRGGAQNYRAFGANPVVYQAVAPETVTEYEIGLKSELFDRRLRLNAAFFYDKYVDVQRSVLQLIGASLTTLITNAAKADLKGFEAEATLRANDYITIDGAVGYLDAGYKSFSDNSGPGGTVRDRTNEPWPAPKWNYRIGARLSYPISGGTLTARADYVWQDDLNLSPAAAVPADVTQKAYGMINARVGLALDDYGAEISLFGRNLTNKKVYTSAVSFESVGFNTMQ